MGVVAAGTFHISVDQFYFPCRIRRLALRYQGSHQVRGILYRCHQAERMRTAQVLPERVSIGPVAGGLELAIRGRLSHGHSAIVATETQTAGNAERWLGIAGLMVRGAGVGSVLRFR